MCTSIKLELEPRLSDVDIRVVDRIGSVLIAIQHAYRSEDFSTSMIFIGILGEASIKKKKNPTYHILYFLIVSLCSSWKNEGSESGTVSQGVADVFLN